MKSDCTRCGSPGKCNGKACKDNIRIVKKYVQTEPSHSCKQTPLMTILYANCLILQLMMILQQSSAEGRYDMKTILPLKERRAVTQQSGTTTEGGLELSQTSLSIHISENYWELVPCSHWPHINMITDRILLPGRLPSDLRIIWTCRTVVWRT
jgi:hypothetical protein